MSKLNSKKVKFYIFLVVFIVGLTYLFFNEYGILKYVKLQSELNSLNEKISKVDEENKSLEAEIDSLKRKIPAKIEKVAREKYHMIRKGERSIEIIEK